MPTTVFLFRCRCCRSFFAPRCAQGTAADIMKKAMVLVAHRLDAWRASLEDGLDCPRLIMQVSFGWCICISSVITGSDTKKRLG